MNLVLQVEKLPGAEDLPAPEHMTSEAAGLDLRAAVTDSVTLAPGDYAVIPTGLRIALPKGHEGQVRPRSGLAAKHGVTTLNAPGTIDADYRGEVRVILINHGKEPFTVTRGERIAQLIVAPVRQVTVAVVDRLDGTARGEGGFGHTGR